MGTSYRYRCINTLGWNKSIEYYFATGDCKGCPHYEEFLDCVRGVCEPIKLCQAIEWRLPITECKQYQEDKDVPSDKKVRL
jgi:hypothetical protein